MYNTYLSCKAIRIPIMSMACKQAQPLVSFQGGGFEAGLNMEAFFRRKDKVVFVIGATGTGKSRLAIDLATRFPSEIINSDKMQVYKGLEIATNKVTNEECRGVPHHLLGVTDPNSNFSAADFCLHASSAIESILDQGKLPIIAGGSNSYIDALLNDHHHDHDHDHDNDPYQHSQFRLRNDCCFLWVDISLPVLDAFVSERVDRMVAAGLVDEVRGMFDPAADYSLGIRRAIGVPELDELFHAEAKGANKKTRERLLQLAIEKIKENTCTLARRQLQKIRRLHPQWSWNVHRLDATEAFLKRRRHQDADEAWENLVVEPANMIVGEFLYREGIAAMVPSKSTISTGAGVVLPSTPAQVSIAAVAGATR